MDVETENSPLKSVPKVDEVSSRFASFGNMGMVVLSILLYSFVSLAVVFLNRQLFAVSFKYPVFVSWFQQAVGVAMYTGIVRLTSRYHSLPSLFPTVTWDWNVVWKIMPLSLAFVGMIGFSNACLQHTPVSTYMVAKSLTLLFNLIFSTILLSQSISLPCWLACFIVISGFVVGSFDPTSLTPFGMLLGASSSAFQAFYNVQTKRSLAFVGDNENVLLFYNLAISSILFLPLIFVFSEGRAFVELPYVPWAPDFWATWSQLLFSAIFGFSLTLATYFCVKTTSPVTFNVVGYAKASVQSVFGITFLGEPWSPQSISGIMLTLVGSFAYSRAKLSSK